MVKTPKTRHTRRHREPVTLDLEAEAVQRPDEIAVDDIREEQGTAAVEGSEPGATTESSSPATAPATVSSEEVAMQADAPAPADEPAEEKPSSAGFGRTASDSAAERSGRGKANEAPASPPPVPAKRGGFSVIAAGLIGAVIALAGAGLLHYAGVLPSGPQDTGQASQLAALRAEVEALKSAPAPEPVPDPALQSTVEELRSNFAALEKAVAGAGGGQDTKAIDDRLKALETSIAGLDRSVGADPAALAALDEKVAAVGSQTEAAGESVAAVEQKVAAIEQSVASLAAKVDAQASQPKIALAISTSALKSALERGAPFSAELETFAAIAPAAPQLDALRRFAEAGVPTRAAIEAEVDAAAGAMVVAGAPVDENAGYFNRLVSSARSLVTIRPTGKVEGSGIPEIVARMEADVKDGDYEAALTEYASLPDAPKAAGADFAAKLRARLDAETLVDQAIAGAMQAG